MLGVNGLPKSTLPELFWSLLQDRRGRKQTNKNQLPPRPQQNKKHNQKTPKGNITLFLQDNFKEN